MKQIKIEDLYQKKYTATVLNVIRQQWRDNDTYNFFGNMKKQHLFLFFQNCNATFRFRDGSLLFAPRNCLIYVPEESEYEVVFSNCDVSTPHNCISINFKLHDQEQMPFALDHQIRIFHSKRYSHFLQTAGQIADAYQSAMQSPMKATGYFYILLSDLSNDCHVNEHILPKYNVIAKGIQALESNCDNTIKIRELAKMCNVSPVYFRKLFLEYAGTTPLDYKLNTIISQAKQHLLYSDKSIGEVADILGFSSATYFCRIFKKKTGLSPMQFIKLHNRAD